MPVESGDRGDDRIGRSVDHVDVAARPAEHVNPRSGRIDHHLLGASAYLHGTHLRVRGRIDHLEDIRRGPSIVEHVESRPVRAHPRGEGGPEVRDRRRHGIRRGVDHLDAVRSHVDPRAVRAHGDATHSNVHRHRRDDRVGGRVDHLDAGASANIRSHVRERCRPCRRRRDRDEEAGIQS